MARVLVIDDDPAYATLISSELRSWGHEVESAPNGRKALFLLAETSYDLIVTDILMPEMDGIEFINKARSGSRPPILAMSGYGSDRSINFLKVAKIFGADASLRKPFTPEELHDVVNALLAGEDVPDKPTEASPATNEDPSHV